MASNGPPISTTSRFGNPTPSAPRFANSVAGDDYATSVQKAQYFSGVQGQNVNAMQCRRAATSQVLDLGYEAYTSFDKARQHQGAIGSFVESAANVFGVKGSAINVDKRIREDQQVGYDLVNSIGSSDVAGATFNKDYGKSTGFDYDPNRPVVSQDDPRMKDGKFGGALGDANQAVEDYNTSQARGMTAFNVAIGLAAGAAAFPLGGFAGVAAGAGLAVATTVGTTAIEDSTRGDGTHDFGAGDYLKIAGISAAASLAGAGIAKGVSSMIGKEASTAASGALGKGAGTATGDALGEGTSTAATGALGKGAGTATSDALGKEASTAASGALGKGAGTATSDATTTWGSKVSNYIQGKFAPSSAGGIGSFVFSDAATTAAGNPGAVHAVRVVWDALTNSFKYLTHA